MNFSKVIILNLSLILFSSNLQATNTFTNTDNLISHLYSSNMFALVYEQDLEVNFEYKNNNGLPYLNKVSSKIIKADSHTTSPIHLVSITNFYDHQLIELKFHLTEATPINITVSNADGELIQSYFAKGLQDANVMHLSTKDIKIGKYQIVLSVKNTSIYHQINISQEALKKPKA